jgi:hypothetical protein
MARMAMPIAKLTIVAAITSASDAGFILKTYPKFPIESMESGGIVRVRQRDLPHAVAGKPGLMSGRAADPGS